MTNPRDNPNYRRRSYRKEAGLFGSIWQGKQEEGSLCNALEFIWSKGDEILDNAWPAMTMPEQEIGAGSKVSFSFAG
jgi:hypothetical protein